MKLRFDPLALGPFDTAIPIVSDANNSPTILNLSGKGGVQPSEIFADGFEDGG